MVSSFSFPVLNPSDFALIEDAQSLPGKKQKVKRLLFKEHERLARSVVVAVETTRDLSGISHGVILESVQILAGHSRSEITFGSWSSPICRW